MSPAPYPAAVVFDCDGLLLDTEGLWAEAERRFVEGLGGTWEPGMHRLTHGRAVPESARLLSEAARGRPAGPSAAEDLTELFTGVVADASPGALLMPGAVALLDRLAAAGVPAAVASNTPPPHLGRLLERAGLRGRFTAVVGPAKGLRPKPLPDVYLDACRRLGVGPAAAHALEDSQTGVDAALAAGLTVTGVNADPEVRLTGCRRAASLTALVPEALGPSAGPAVAAGAAPAGAPPAAPPRRAADG